MDTHPYHRLSPPDAATALRSFGRRFRDAATSVATSLDDDLDEHERDELADRPGGDGWSAVDHVVGARNRVESAHAAIRGALVNADQRIDDELLGLEAGPVPGPGGGLDEALDSLDAAARRLADLVDGADARGWSEARRTIGGGTATALDVLQVTVAFVLDRMKDLERVLREVRGRSS